MLWKSYHMKKIILPYKWELVILLWIAFFFNQADRQIFNVVLPLIRDDLHLTDADMGLVASVLTLLYGILVPIAGLIGDRISKKKIIIISLLVWSGATLLTGISTTLIELIILRSVATGGGEAFYSPSANSSISEVHVLPFQERDSPLRWCPFGFTEFTPYLCTPKRHSKRKGIRATNEL